MQKLDHIRRDDVDVNEELVDDRQHLRECVCTCVCVRSIGEGFACGVCVRMSLCMRMLMCTQKTISHLRQMHAKMHA
jgi:hypothetical protein